MPVKPTYPGVYVEEIPIGARSIAPASTSVALFIGRMPWGSVDLPVMCNSYGDFEREFTGDPTLGALPHAVRLFFSNGGTQCYVMRLNGTTAAGERARAAVANTAEGKLMATAVHPGTAGNTIRFVISHPPGQTDAYTFTVQIFRVKNTAAALKTDLEVYDGVSLQTSSPTYIGNYVKSRWLKFDVINNEGRPDENARGADREFIPYSVGAGTDGEGLSVEDYRQAFITCGNKIDIFNLLLLPADTSLVDTQLLWKHASGFCQERRAFLLLDPPTAWTGTDPGAMSTSLVALYPDLVKDHSAVFFPNILINDSGTQQELGPAGAIAGVIARTDANRGVWKSPAGMEAILTGITGLAYRLNEYESETLNRQGINAIRIFPSGIVNWGARTMAGNDQFASEWKYIAVKRTALFIEESLYRGLQWVVFEPNNENLWAQVCLTAGAFLQYLYRQGAFQGASADKAYFIRCDTSTNTQQDINLGRLNIQIGFAPLKPAEFVIIHVQIKVMLPG
ncbi:MAG: phage tail sheath C-terminal domain-containing protein [Chitinophagaceae bacterium]